MVAPLTDAPRVTRKLVQACCFGASIINPAKIMHVVIIFLFIAVIEINNPTKISL
jgi:hypothetical protein